MLLVISGEAGSGKDTVAEKLATYLNAECVSFADPIKRIVFKAFDFPYDVLWGESSKRNLPDSRYFAGSPEWPKARNRLINTVTSDQWLRAANLEISQPILLDWISQLEANCEADPITPRLVLQTLGTEIGRALFPNIWVDLATHQIGLLLKGNHSYSKIEGAVPSLNSVSSVIVTDGRFPNEIQAIKRMGGKTLRIVSPDSAKTRAAFSKHASESAMKTMPDSSFDFVYRNDKAQGLEKLSSDIKNLIVPFLTK